jgi:hypothetical protein
MPVVSGSGGNATVVDRPLPVLVDYLNVLTIKAKEWSVCSGEGGQRERFFHINALKKVTHRNRIPGMFFPSKHPGLNY